MRHRDVGGGTTHSITNGPLYQKSIADGTQLAQSQGIGSEIA
jgi:hypothetical protein